MTLETRPTRRPPQTLRQAKAEFKKHGPRLSSQEVRQLERGHELLKRAEKIKETERRRKAATKKREEKERKEREALREARRNGQNPVLAEFTSKWRPAPSQQLLEGFVKVEKLGTSIKRQREEDDTLVAQEAKRVKVDLKTAGSFKLDTIEEEETWDIEDKGFETSEVLGANRLSDAVEGSMIKEKHLGSPASPGANMAKGTSPVTEAHGASPHMLLKEAELAYLTPVATEVQEALNEFLVSSTQIQRDISSPEDNASSLALPAPSPAQTAAPNNTLPKQSNGTENTLLAPENQAEEDTLIPFLSTQDISLSDNDILEIGFTKPRERPHSNPSSNFEARATIQPSSATKSPQTVTPAKSTPFKPGIKTGLPPNQKAETISQRDQRLMPPPRLPGRALRETQAQWQPRGKTTSLEPTVLISEDESRLTEKAWIGNRVHARISGTPCRPGVQGFMQDEKENSSELPPLSTQDVNLSEGDMEELGLTPARHVRPARQFLCKEEALQDKCHR